MALADEEQVGEEVDHVRPAYAPLQRGTAGAQRDRSGGARAGRPRAGAQRQAVLQTLTGRI